MQLIDNYLGSLNNISKTSQEDNNISISHQTIENFIYKENNELKDSSDRFSGYYVFDVQWVKLNELKKKKKNLKKINSF